MQVVVLAKYPTPGAVKTRLARVLGEVEAAALSRAFVLDLAERLRVFGTSVLWAYWPPDAPFSALVPGARCIPQQGTDLGERLAAAMATALAAGRPPVLALGTDTPHLPLAALEEAEGALAAGADVVLGPAADGGYYLLGLTAIVPALFADIPWGTRAVLHATLARAAAAGLRVHLLSPTFDVDEIDDLHRLQALVACREVDLPHTSAVLVRLRGVV